MGLDNRSTAAVGSGGACTSSGAWRREELRRTRFHDLRHTFESLLIQNGDSLAYVKDQPGHSSIKMTVDVYGHLVPGANRQAVNRLSHIRQASTF